MNKTFYIFRHGLSTKSLFGYGDKIVTAELLPEGKPPIKKMGKYLKNVSTDFCVRSEFIRCQQTSDIIAKATNKKFINDKRLNEYNDETFDNLRDRTKDFLENIEKSNYKDILICTHGAVIAALKNLILKNKFTIFQLYDYPKTGMLLIIKEGKIEEIDFN
ncbi:MAG: histidine phosphatase family protein [Candidatus Levyibacteriota bacterium]|nr:MAG: histidine phosphatase family protein [Candidatus Levybacteria bacterium]